METTLDTALQHAPSGLSYSIVEDSGRLHQVEFLAGPGGRRLHELRRRIDYVMGSGQVARTYFTEENGRLFQLPLTWYRDHGWDFSPGYEVNNARFERWMPDRCIACHSNYPQPLPFLEGKYAELRPGIGCERCHGPGEMHVELRSGDGGERGRNGDTNSTAPAVPVSANARDSAYDPTIVNPARLPLARRLDVCEQCHVHTAVAVLREGKNDFSYLPSQRLSDQWAFFKVSGDIDIVSHADRLRQSACFLATHTTSRPLECASCHNPHQPPREAQARSGSCRTCHTQAALEQRLARSASLNDHTTAADCVSCHMPRVRDRAVPHGTFTDHWIRVVGRESARPTRRSGSEPIEPFFERDVAGPEAAIYRAMGEVVYANLANDGRVLANAARALDRALGNDTARGDARFLLGVAHQQLGRTTDAIRSLEQSVRADSNNPDRLRALAQAYERLGRAPAVVGGLYQRALSLQPALAWIRADYADFLHGQGLHDQAERAYRAALAEQPSLAVGWFNLGTLLGAERRLGEASDAFREAVRLDPSLGQALSPLFEVSTSGAAVAGVDSLGSPLASLPVRDRGPRAIQLGAVASGAGVIRVINVPPRAAVQVLDPDGTVVRALPAPAGPTVDWDLRTDSGVVIGGGLYRLRVQAPDASGRLRTAQLYFGVVRRRM